MPEPDFKWFVESAPDTIILLDRDDRYVYVSPAIREATGGLLTPEDLIGKHPHEVGYPDEHLREITVALAHTRATGRDHALHFDYETATGTRHFQAIIRPERTREGHVESLLAIVRDVTDLKRLQEELAAARIKAEEQAEALRMSSRARERAYLEVEKRVGERTLALEAEIAVRKQSEERLRESEERYRAIVEDLTEFVSRFTPDGVITFVNGALNRFHGTTTEEHLGRNLFDLLPPSASEDLRRLLASATWEQPFVSSSHRMSPPSGEERWLEWVNRALFDENGRIIEFQAVGRDITEQKRAKEALARREQEFRALAENSPDIIVRYNRDVVRLYANAALSRALNKPRSDLIGKDLSNAPMAAPMRKEFAQTIRSVFETGQERTFVLKLDLEEGGRHIQYRLAPEFSRSGQVESVLSIGRDITDLVRLEQELRQSKEAAEASSQAKSTFLSNMSHEIRTPLNSILSVLELLPMLGIGREATSYVGIAEQAAGHLLGLINNLLDLSKIEAGRIELARKPFEPRHLLQAILRPLAVTAGLKGLELELDVAEDVPVRLMGDELRLGQVLLNLVGNAIKYTDTGLISVNVKRDGIRRRSGRQVEILFAVRDTGMGIPRDQREGIFEGFRQFLDPGRPLSESTGLGLHISRLIVERMDGRIWVESEPGQGSTFFFTIVLEEAEPETCEIKEPARTPQSTTPRPLRILLVEDNLVNQMLTSEILMRKGHDVVTASDGREALDALRDGRFDVVLMDVNMPGMDGLETTRHIREGRAGDPDVPIVATTAFGLDGDRERFLRAGMNEHISKPFVTAELEEVLAGISARGEQARQGLR